MADTQADVIAAFKADVQDAVSFIESDLSPLRAQATRFYNAEPFGDEEEGRSQIVTPTVREVVRATLPSLMRIFFGGNRVVEYTGTNELSADYADEMTEAAHQIFMRHNPGFSIAWDAFKDALVRKVGWMHWYWSESVDVKSRMYSGCSIEQLAELDAELGPDETLEVVDGAEGPAEKDPQTGEQLESQILYRVRLISKKKKKQVVVESVPPEEIIISRDAKSPYTAKLIGRRSLKTRGDLVAMGISEEILTEAGGAGGNTGLDTNEERLARGPSALHNLDVATETADQKKILYVDAYYMIDADGDGISERRHICTVGDAFQEVHNEYADEVQLAAFCPDPEPHTVWGLSQADNVADLQIINSHVMRDILDGTKASIFPRSVVVEGQANMDDVLNTEIGAAIRVRSHNAVTFAQSPFNAQQAYQLLDHLEGQKEQRTGLSKNAAGLDPRALQSTNPIAVAATVTASQAQPELIARIFAETGMKRMFRGVLKTLVENHKGQYSVQIRGEWKSVNPVKWDIDAEMEVDTGLGVGSNDSKISVLNATAASQTLALKTLGLDNPLCGLQELYNTQKKLLELQGFKNVHRFWRDPSLMEPEPEKEPEPTPEEVLAEAQMKISAGELELKTLETILKDDRDRDKNEAEVFLKAIEIQSEYGKAVDLGALRAIIDRKRIDSQALRTRARAE